MQFPYPPIPATTPPNRNRFRGSSSGPNRSGSSSAAGRAPIDRTSRTIPPTPVAAPWYGSIGRRVRVRLHLEHARHAVAEVHDARVLARARPAPAGPLGGERPQVHLARLVRAVLDHMRRYMASSARFGSRPEPLDDRVDTPRRSGPAPGAGGCRHAGDAVAGRRQQPAEDRLPAGRPRSGSTACSGCGIRPSTLPRSFHTPAMFPRGAVRVDASLDLAVGEQ